MEKQVEGILIPHPDQPIAEYSEFRAQLDALKKDDAGVVFDYFDPKGNKQARSYVAKLRRSKTAIDEVRKDVKSQALEFSRRVDGEAKALIGEVQEIIDRHVTKLDEVEQVEKDRVANLEARLEQMRQASVVDHSKSSSELIEDLEHLEGFVVGPDLQEYESVAAKIIEQGSAAIRAQILVAQDREEKEAELERLRAAEAERQRQEQEERLRREGEERARQAAEAERKAAEDRAAEAERARVQAEERARVAAEQAEARAKQAAADAEARIQREQEEASRREAAEREARERDVEHRKAINSQALADLVASCPGVDAEAAKAVIVAIARGKVRNVQITY